MLLSIIIPVFNEKQTVGNIIKRTKTAAQKNNLEHEIIVVDDYSEDGSPEISKKMGAKVYRLTKHMGKGYALRAGFAKAKGDIIATIDSDGSHRPEELPLLLAPILKNEAELVIGSRYSDKKPVSARKLNAFGVALFDSLIGLITKTKVTDSQSGYRAMKSIVLSKMSLESEGYEIESEMLVKITRRGFRIKEVPISFEQRTYGRSGIDPLVDGFKILFSIIKAYAGG